MCSARRRLLLLLHGTHLQHRTATTPCSAPELGVRSRLLSAKVWGIDKLAVALGFLACSTTGAVRDACNHTETAQKSRTDDRNGQQLRGSTSG